MPPPARRRCRACGGRGSERGCRCDFCEGSGWIEVPPDPDKMRPAGGRIPAGRALSPLQDIAQIEPMNDTKSTVQKPLAPAAGFMAVVEGEAEANQASPRYWRGKRYPGPGCWERHVWARGQRLPAPAKAVLRCIVDHDWGGGPVFPSIATIAAETGLSRAGTTKALRWLRDQGWFEIGERRNGYGGRASNVYAVLAPPATA